MRRAILILGLAVLSGEGRAAPARASGEPSASPSTVARARFLMGTRLSIVLPAPAPEATFDTAFAEVERLDAVMSNWIDTSELGRMNSAAAAGAFSCSPDLFAAIDSALHWAEVTGGAFDPTVEPLTRAYGLRGREGRIEPVATGSGTTGSPGDRVGLSSRPRAPVGWRHVRIGRPGRTVEFDQKGVGIDLGGIGKGIALDAAARVLVRRRIDNALLDFGGQILALGSPPGRIAWPVAIADPLLRGRAVEWIEMRDGSVSTSGNSERAIAGEGGPIGHILDPVGQAPAAFEGSVTVIAADATSADALSTALFVMGPGRGTVWADQHRVAVLYLERGHDGRLVRTASAAFWVASHLSGGQ
jgi:FAD:protein FMN transferase